MATTDTITTILEHAQRLVAQGLSLEQAAEQALASAAPRSSSGARSIVDRAVGLEGQGQRADDALAAATQGRAPAVVRRARRTFALLGAQGKRTEASRRAHQQLRGEGGRFA